MGKAMSDYSREKGRDFWYDFDNQTLWNRTPAVTGALQRGYFSQGLSLDSLADELRASFAREEHPQPFVARIEAGGPGLWDLAAIQLQIINAHLSDSDAIRSAFEDFGQGVLFDDRDPRPPGRRIHMMDGTPDTWVGYQRWYAFMRAARLLGSGPQRWLDLQRALGLAWAIQTEADPAVDNPNNPGLPAERLALLRTRWTSLSAEQLDWAFATHRFRAPSPDALTAMRAPAPTADAQPFTYAHVQQIFNNGAGNAQPNYDGQGRFWLLPLEEFLKLPPIYGQQLIAAPGANRGARSPLVQILRGTLPNFPQMPLNRPPLSGEDIAHVQAWIDSLPVE